MSSSSGGAAEAAAERKTAKYIQLAQTYTFIPIAVETLRPMNSVGLQFLSDLERKFVVDVDSRVPSRCDGG